MTVIFTYGNAVTDVHGRPQ